MAIPIAALLAATLSLCALALVAAPALARDAAVATPALWKIDGPNGDIYLFGSIHLLPKGVNWRTPAVDAALKQAQTVTFEIELDDAKNFAESQRLIGKLGLLPQGQPERARRVLEMVERMDLEGFGGCTNFGECTEACPKEIGLWTIARLNADFLRASATRRPEAATAGAG